MVQTIGQYAGDQSPLSSGALQGVTAEGDAVAMTMCPGNALKHAVSAPSADRSTNFLQCACADQESLAEGSLSLNPNATAGVSVPCGAGHGRVAQPGAEGISNPFPRGESASPWARHQEPTHKLSAYTKQQPVGSHYVGEGAPRISARSVPV